MRLNYSSMTNNNNPTVFIIVNIKKQPVLKVEEEKPIAWKLKSNGKKSIISFPISTGKTTLLDESLLDSYLLKF